MQDKILKTGNVAGWGIVALGLVAGEPLIGFLVGTVVGTAVNFARSGWSPREFSVLAYVVIGLIGVYLATANNILAEMRPKVDEGLAQKEVILQHETRISASVVDFARHFREQKVAIIKDRKEEAKLGSLAHILTGDFGAPVLSWAMQGYTIGLPDELGRDPIFPLQSGIEAAGRLILIDVANSRIHELEKSEPGNEEFSQIYSMECHMSHDGGVLRMGSREDFWLLDLTEEPAFEPIKEVCENAWSMDETPGEFIPQTTAMLNDLAIQAETAATDEMVDEVLAEIADEILEEPLDEAMAELFEVQL